MRLEYRCGKKNNRQSGAVLLAVLVVSLVLVILLGVVSFALNNRLTLGQQAKQSLQDSAAVYAKINELSYLLATQRMTMAGISTGRNAQGLQRDDEGHWALKVIGDEIRTDGYIYEIANQMQYSIQNESGLIPINSSEQYWLKKWLASYGISTIEQAYYADILADYADSDDWRRAAGAESFNYQKQHMLPPRNFLLQDCHELYRVLRWTRLISEQKSMIRQCGLGRSERLNINAIPAHLLEQLWPSVAAKIIDQRAHGSWFIYQNDILRLIASVSLTPEEYYATLGGDNFGLTVRRNGIKLTRRIALGTGKSAPFVRR